MRYVMPCLTLLAVFGSLLPALQGHNKTPAGQGKPSCHSSSVAGGSRTSSRMDMLAPVPSTKQCTHSSCHARKPGTTPPTSCGKKTHQPPQVVTPGQPNYPPRMYPEPGVTTPSTPQQPGYPVALQPPQPNFSQSLPPAQPNFTQGLPPQTPGMPQGLYPPQPLPQGLQPPQPNYPVGIPGTPGQLQTPIAPRGPSLTYPTIVARLQQTLPVVIAAPAPLPPVQISLLTVIGRVPPQTSFLTAVSAPAMRQPMAPRFRAGIARPTPLPDRLVLETPLSQPPTPELPTNLSLLTGLARPVAVDGFALSRVAIEAPEDLPESDPSYPLPQSRPHTLSTALAQDLPPLPLLPPTVFQLPRGPASIPLSAAAVPTQPELPSLPTTSTERSTPAPRPTRTPRSASVREPNELPLPPTVLGAL